MLGPGLWLLRTAGGGHAACFARGSQTVILVYRLLLFARRGHTGIVPPVPCLLRLDYRERSGQLNTTYTYMVMPGMAAFSVATVMFRGDKRPGARKETEYETKDP